MEQDRSRSKEADMPRVAEALELFSGGFACSQAVLAVFCERYGLDVPMALRLATGFGGGMKRGEVCGAVTGAIMVVGLRHGHVDAADRDARRLAGEKTAELLRAFTERRKALTCRDLLGCDITTPDGRRFAMEHALFATTCRDAVADAVAILESLGY